VAPATGRQTGAVLHDVDRSVASWLASVLPAGVEIAFAPPGGRSDDAPARKGNKGAPEQATVLLHLHLVREDADASTVGWRSTRGPDGAVDGRLPPDQRFRIVYLLAAWADDPLAEHELLGRILVAAAALEVLPDEAFCGCLAGEPRAILMRCAPANPTADPAALWAAWRLAPRAVLELSLLVPLPRTPTTDLPPPPQQIDLSSERRAPVPAGAGAERVGPLPRRRARIEEG
jgi:hypothetical protein